MAAPKLQKIELKVAFVGQCCAALSSLISDMWNQMEHLPQQKTDWQLLKLEIPSHSAPFLCVNTQLLLQFLCAFTFGPPPTDLHYVFLSSYSAWPERP